VLKKTGKPKQSLKSQKSFRWWHIALLLILIAALFFMLEKMKARYQIEAVVKPAKVESQLMPEPGAHLEDHTMSHVSARKTAPRSHLPGTLAVIVDDMGSSLNEARELLAINIPLTFSLIPGLPKVNAVAELADSAGQTIMVHLPERLGILSKG
jgi:hypothetical protein